MAVSLSRTLAVTISLPRSAETIEALQAAGKTVILVGTRERILGVVAVADEIRPEAKQTVERLHELGVKRIVMLTGDNEVTARAVGEMAGVDEVRAELLPRRKPRQWPHSTRSSAA